MYELGCLLEGWRLRLVEPDMSNIPSQIPDLAHGLLSDLRHGPCLQLRICEGRDRRVLKGVSTSSHTRHVRRGKARRTGSEFSESFVEQNTGASFILVGVCHINALL